MEKEYQVSGVTPLSEVTPLDGTYQCFDIALRINRGGVVPHPYCDSPGHAQNSKKCLRVEQPFLQLRAKFQAYISSQKVFRDTCVRAVDILVSRRGLYGQKH